MEILKVKRVLSGDDDIPSDDWTTFIFNHKDDNVVFLTETGDSVCHRRALAAVNNAFRDFIIFELHNTTIYYKYSGDLDYLEYKWNAINNSI